MTHDSVEVPGTTPTPISLSIEDLRFYRGFIDIAVSRGAVFANEMEITGRFYKRLSDFLASVDASAEPIQPTPSIKMENL